MKSVICMWCLAIFVIFNLFYYICAQQTIEISGPFPLKPANISSNDQFGFSVAVGTSVIACGAPNTNNSNGAVDVFTVGTQVQVANLWGHNAQGPSQFGWSVAILNDNMIAVGALSYGAQAGAVHVFEQTTPSSWNEIFFSPGVSSGDEFGWRVALTGNLSFYYLAVACRIGLYVQVFKYNGGTFTLETTITTQSPVNSLAFYESESFVDLFIGTPHVNNDFGEVQLFRKISGLNTWNFVQTLNATNTLLFMLFGASLSVDANRIYVGAYGQNRVYRFALNDSDLLWYDEGGFVTPNDTTSQFGYSIASFNGITVIGAPGDATNGSQSGAAYVTVSDKIIGKLFGSTGSEFGYTVAGSGANFVVGAPYDNTFSSGAGAAYLYNTIFVTPSTVPSTTTQPAPSFSPSTSSPSTLSSPIISTQTSTSPLQTPSSQATSVPPKLSRADLSPHLTLPPLF
jgi:hypothetical protein